VFLGEIYSSKCFYKEKKKEEDLNVEFKNLESKRQIGKFEKGNAEE